jgi:hypothetical protein
MMRAKPSYFKSAAKIYLKMGFKLKDAILKHWLWMLSAGSYCVPVRDALVGKLIDKHLQPID